MGIFDEDDFEEVVAAKLQNAGWTRKLAVESSRKITEVIDEDALQDYLRFRYADASLDADAYAEIISKVKNVRGSTGYRRMVAITTLVREGYTLVPKTPGKEPFLLEYIDFVHPERNIFEFVTQFEFREGKKTRIPDIVLFVNGIPLVVIELKSPTQKNATIADAHSQIYKRYWTDIPRLMSYCPLAVLSDGAQTRLGTSVSPFEFFYAWKKVENEDAAGVAVDELDSMIEGALKPERLLEIYRDYLYFPDVAQGEEREIAIVCRYPQFFAARKLKEHILGALRSGGGDGKGGLYFGATGCGKTYTMLFLSRLLALRCRGRLGSPTLLLIVDREDLSNQAGKLFCTSTDYLCDKNVRIFESREDLATELASRKSGGVYITTIQKFTETMGLLSDRSNIICMSDEAHRTQNNIGSSLKTKDLGAFISHGFAVYLRKALPNATYCGFTGTPIDEAVAVFGGIVDQYTMHQAREDGITVDIHYDPRLARIFLDNAKAEEIEAYYRQCEKDGASEDDVNLSKKAMSDMKQILGDPDRLERVALDIIHDYETRRDENPALLQKAMVTCSDRMIAWELYKKIVKHRPEWGKPLKSLGESALPKKKLEKLKACPYINLVATRDEKKDPKELYVLLGDAQYRKELAEAFKDDDSNFHIAIVVDMWITGFDCPSLTYLYNDKPLQKHTLIQTISRVNRRYKTKACGVIIDYIGIREKMKQAMRQYGGSGFGGGASTLERDIEAAHKILQTELKILRELCHQLDFTPFIKGTPLQKLHFLQTGAEFVLAQTVKSDDPKVVSFKATFVGHVKRLRAAYALCNPAGVISPEEALWSQCFMTICSYLQKMTAKEHDTERMNREVEQMVQEALLCTGIESVLDHEQKDVEAIFGDDFMSELNKVDMPNTKFQLLVRMISRVIRDYKRTNKIRGEYFEKLLASTVEEYNTRDKLVFANDIATDTFNAVSDVVNEKIESLSAQLLQLLKDIETDKVNFKALGISFEEKAFYDILVDLRDTHQFEYSDERCKVLAKKIKTLADSVSIYADFINNQNLRSQLSTDLTTLLYVEGFPPIWDEEVFDKVLEQMKHFKDHRKDDYYDEELDDAENVTPPLDEKSKYYYRGLGAEAIQPSA